MFTSLILSVFLLLLVASCSTKFHMNLVRTPTKDNATDTNLRKTITTLALTGDPLVGRTVPNINEEKSQLGMRLFFSKSLGGDRDSACVSCHHPALGGGDNLSLPIGVGAENADLLGYGRKHSQNSEGFDGGPTVPRNAPTTFNMIAWDEVLFHDGRVESLGKTPSKNGDDGQGIRTPDSTFGTQDDLAGSNLTQAQARFPVTSNEEMKGFNHEDKGNQEIREFLASRIGGFGVGAGELNNTEYWLNKFQTALNNPTGTAQELITEQNISMLIGEYERSQVFIDNPWKQYIDGDDNAISEAAKEGALIFFRTVAEGGANCASCHSGDFFTDEKFHNIAIPQMGRGKGDGDGLEDFGRSRETGDDNDKYAFRTPTLLNVEITGPWSHSGAYTSLKEVVLHHLDPVTAVTNYDFNQLTQSGIQNLDKLKTNTRKALIKLAIDRLAGKDVIQSVQLTDTEVDNLVEFLKTLTDPCTQNRACLSPWIPDPINDVDPNGDQLNAVDINNLPL